MSNNNHFVVGSDLEPKREKPVFLIKTLAASATLTVDDAGTIYEIGVDAVVVTLPAVGATTAPRGTTFKFRNIGADGGNPITITPNASDAIFGTIANAAADSVASGTDGESLINTELTANKGDWVEIQSDGSTGWYISGGVGIWASS